MTTSVYVIMGFFAGLGAFVLAARLNSAEAVAGTGALHSFIVVHQPVAPGYLDQLPYVVGLIELDEQEALRIPARVVGSAPEDLRIGDRMTAEVIALPGGDYHVAVFHHS